jgi:hypothetical protein
MTHSRINFKPTFWGDKLWIVINTIVFSFHKDHTLNENEHRALVLFCTSLPELLPCKSCRRHAKMGKGLFDGIEKLKTGKDIQQFVVNVHNSVNERLGKATVTWDQVNNDYTPNPGTSGDVSSHQHTPGKLQPKRVSKKQIPVVVASVIVTFVALAIIARRRKTSLLV